MVWLNESWTTPAFESGQELTADQLNEMRTAIDEISDAVGVTGVGCPDGYVMVTIGHFSLCLEDGAEISSDCCYPNCGNYGDWEIYTWARNNGGTLQTRVKVIAVGATPDPYCDSGWVNGDSSCSYWEITGFATLTATGLQGKLMQGSTNRCTGPNTPW